MEFLRSHPGATSAAAGILFAIGGFVLGGGSTTPVGIVLAALLGAVFAVAMYAGARRSRRS